jgi:hypothetical protein
MPISPMQLQDQIRVAGFPVEKRPQVCDIVTRGLESYRDYKTKSYYGSKGTAVKKPTTAHHPPAGRHDQTGARTILISALCRAWMEGFGQAPTLNNKKDPDTPFFNFAMQVMALEGIGKVHNHLEDYWSTRKKTWLENDRS